MRLLYRKLKDDRGASFIIAMVYFLVCMMVGSVMISAAASDRGRVASMTEEQKLYFEVESAAELFKEVLQNVSFEDYFEYYGTGTGYGEQYEGVELDAVDEGSRGTYTSSGDYYKKQPNMKPNAEGSGMENILEADPVIDYSMKESGIKSYESIDSLYNTIAAYARDVFYKTSENVPSVTYLAERKLSCRVRLGDSEMPVDVAMTMGRDYSLYINFKNINNDEGVRSHGHSITLKLTPTVNPDNSTDVISYKVTENITVGDSTEPTLVDRDISIEKTGVKVTWSGAEIVRGDETHAEADYR